MKAEMLHKIYFFGHYCITELTLRLYFGKLGEYNSLQNMIHAGYFSFNNKNNFKYHIINALFACALLRKMANKVEDLQEELQRHAKYIYFNNLCFLNFELKLFISTVILKTLQYLSWSYLMKILMINIIWIFL